MSADKKIYGDRMPGRNAQVSRIYALLNILEGAPQGLTVKELCDRVQDQRHSASKRTIYRDLEALAAAGFPLFPVEENTEDSFGTRWKLERTAKINQYLVLSAREIVSLFLARSALTPLKKTPFYEDLKGVFQKLEEKLGTKAREYLNGLSRDIAFEPTPKWGLGLEADTLDTIRAACGERQVIECEYSSASKGTVTSRRIGPHFMYFAKGSIYLVGEDLGDHKVKVFSIPRMKSAVMVDEEYKGEAVDPEKYFQASFGIYVGGEPEHVEIEFSKQIAPYVRERQWHHSQSVVNRSDGSIMMTFDIALTPEFVQWVLGFGADANVLLPETLRSNVLRSANAILKRYDKKAA